MSHRRLRQIVVKWTGLMLLTVLPTIIALRSTKMDPVNVILIGAGVLWVWIAGVLWEWKHRPVQTIAKNVIVRCGGGILIAFFTGWLAHSVYEPPLTNPEATGNKYIRVKKVAPPDARFESAILIEFGINKVRSEGLAIAVNFKGDTYEDWCGEPDRTEKQHADVRMEYDGQLSATNPVLRLSHETLDVTPRKSYYLCIMSLSKEMEDPNDILYFAVAMNEQTTLPSRKTELGHQYETRQ